MISGVYWIPSTYHIVPKYLQGRILMIPLVRICCSTSVSGYHNEYISSTSYHQIMCFHVIKCMQYHDIWCLLDTPYIPYSTPYTSAWCNGTYTPHVLYTIGYMVLMVCMLLY